MPDVTTCDQIVKEYLSELDRALTSIDPASRQEFIASIGEHIAEGRGELDPVDEAGLGTHSSSLLGSLA